MRKNAPFSSTHSFHCAFLLRSHESSFLVITYSKGNTEKHLPLTVTDLYSQLCWRGFTLTDIVGKIMLFLALVFASSLALAFGRVVSPSPYPRSLLNTTLNGGLTSNFPIACRQPVPSVYTSSQNNCLEAAHSIAFSHRPGRPGQYIDRRKEYLDFSKSLEHSWSSPNHGCLFLWTAGPDWQHHPPGRVRRGVLYEAAFAIMRRCSRDGTKMEYGGVRQVSVADPAHRFGAGWLDFRLRGVAALEVGVLGGNSSVTSA